MIQIRFTSFDFNIETEQWIDVPVAELVADGEAVTISGPHADWISLDIAIVDPDTRERVTRSDDAERWARLLPFAYRNGDISVEVATVEPAGASFHYYAEA
jgi:hypothetical protein